jgi:hypothetical protein
LTVCHPKAKVILAHSRDKLLSSEPLPDNFKDRTLKVLQEAGVEVLLSHRLASSSSVDGANEVEFTNGKKLVAGLVIKAMVKSIPSTSFLPKEALNEEGLINVLPSLQLSGDLPNSEYYFAAGDVVNWSGIKRCGGAMHMGKLVGGNIHQLIVRDLSRSAEKPRFKEMRQIPPMITVAVGKEAVSYGPPFGTSSGKWLMQVFFGEDLGFRRRYMTSGPIVPLLISDSHLEFSSPWGGAWLGRVVDRDAGKPFEHSSPQWSKHLGSSYPRSSAFPKGSSKQLKVVGRYRI